MESATWLLKFAFMTLDLLVYMSKYPAELPSLKFFLTELLIFRDELLEMAKMAKLRHKKSHFLRNGFQYLFQPRD